MVVFGEARRALLAKQLSDVANLAMAGLVFGQVIRGGELSAGAFLWGLGLWATFAGIALAIAGRDKP